MKVKKLISSFLLITMMILMLPVKQVGAILFSNQLTEELPHSCDASKEIKEKSFKDYLLLPSGDAPGMKNASGNAFFISFSCTLPLNHTGEVQTPPPNHTRNS